MPAWGVGGRTAFSAREGHGDQVSRTPDSGTKICKILRSSTIYKGHPDTRLQSFLLSLLGEKPGTRKSPLTALLKVT